jgi:exodeoxyribonuclease VII large subunit
MVIPRREDLQKNINNITADLNLGIDHLLELNLNRYRHTLKKLTLLNPAVLLGQHLQKLRDLSQQITVRANHFLQLKQLRLKGMGERLLSLSPLNILARGYSITFAAEGEVIKNINTVKIGDTIKTRLHQGEISSQVLDKSG